MHQESLSFSLLRDAHQKHSSRTPARQASPGKLDTLRSLHDLVGRVALPLRFPVCVARGAWQG